MSAAVHQPCLLECFVHELASISPSTFYARKQKIPLGRTMRGSQAVPPRLARWFHVGPQSESKVSKGGRARPGPLISNNKHPVRISRVGYPIFATVRISPADYLLDYWNWGVFLMH